MNLGRTTLFDVYLMIDEGIDISLKLDEQQLSETRIRGCFGEESPKHHLVGKSF